jgi:hypothetical protein
MKKILPLLFATVFAFTAKAQTDEAMLKWLNGHISAINLTKSESNGEIQGSGITGKRKIKELKFTKSGVETIGSFAYEKVNMGRLYFLKATIDNELLVLQDRGNNTISLHIADVAIREKYKDVYTRFAYTRKNTNETDLPVYNSDKVDTKTVFPGGEEAWRQFVGKYFVMDPAIKYEVPPGRYEGTISFVVTKDSIVKDFTKAVNSPKGIQEAMLYVASKMPHWVPATLNRKNVSATATIKMTIVVPVLTNSFEDQILKAEALKYQDRNFNTPNYENGNPGYLNLKPLNLDDNNTPDPTKKDNAVKEPVNNKTEPPGDIKLEKWITEPVAYFNSIEPFYEGLAKVYYENAVGVTKYGFINREGKLVVPLKYEKVSNFSHGLAMVSLNDRHGFIDHTGKLVIPMTWDGAGEFSDGVAVVKKGEKYGFIDAEGKVVIPVNLNYVLDFNEGLAPIFNKDGKWGYINKTGSIVIERKFDSNQPFSEGLAIVKMNKKFAFIDKTGESVKGFIYDDAYKFSEGLACVQSDGAYGFINKKEEVVIPFKYAYAYPFSAGLSLVKLNKKYGMINLQGQEVIPCIYDNLSNFQEGLARITVNGQKGFINKEGTVVIKPTYDEAGFSYGGLIATANNSKWLYIDNKGYTAIHEVYDYASDFVGGLAEVEKNGKTFIIDRTGKKWTALK